MCTAVPWTFSSRLQTEAVEERCQYRFTLHQGNCAQHDQMYGIRVAKTAGTPFYRARRLFCHHPAAHPPARPHAHTRTVAHTRRSVRYIRVYHMPFSKPLVLTSIAVKGCNSAYAVRCAGFPDSVIADATDISRNILSLERTSLADSMLAPVHGACSS
jgi:hypothetical protein